MVGSARLRESDVHPISPKTPAPQFQPIERKKRKGKRVEDNSRLFDITKLLANLLTKQSFFLLLCQLYFVILFQ